MHLLQRTLEGVNHCSSQARQDAFNNDHYFHHMKTGDCNNKEEVAPLPGPSTIRDELKDAEVGLLRAKEEYKRLQSEVQRSKPLTCTTLTLPSQLALSSERVRALSRDKEELLSQHEEEVVKLKDIIYSLRNSPTLRGLPSDLLNSVNTPKPSSKVWSLSSISIIYYLILMFIVT